MSPYPDDGFPPPSTGDRSDEAMAQYQLERRLLQGAPRASADHDARIAVILEFLHGG